MFAILFVFAISASICIWLLLLLTIFANDKTVKESEIKNKNNDLVTFRKTYNVYPNGTNSARRGLNNK